MKKLIFLMLIFFSKFEFVYGSQCELRPITGAMLYGADQVGNLFRMDAPSPGNMKIQFGKKGVNQLLESEDGWLVPSGADFYYRLCDLVVKKGCIRGRWSEVGQAYVSTCGCPKTEQLGEGSLKVPVLSFVTSSFGFRKKPRKGRHEGLDFAGGGKCISAAHSGRVTAACEKKGSFGYQVKIEGDGFITTYSHLRRESCRVQKGDTVYPGTPIATSGNSGRSQAPHLHFEVFRQSMPDKPLDPKKYLDKSVMLY